MANKKKKKQQQKVSIQKEMNQPWIGMKTGTRVIALTSLVMAVLTAWQVIPQRGWVEGILWALGFGALIWVIFYGFYYFRRLIK